MDPRSQFAEGLSPEYDSWDSEINNAKSTEQRKEKNIDNTMFVNIEDTEENKKAKCNDIEVKENKILFQCDNCEFECEKQITLNKQKTQSTIKLIQQKKTV